MNTSHKLAAYEFEPGKTVGPDKDPWEETDLNGNEPFVLYDPDGDVPTGYLDISSVSNFNNYYNSSHSDYKHNRDHLKNYISYLARENTLGTESDSSQISSPALNDSYLVGDNAINDFVGHENEIAIWNSSSWDFKWQYEAGFDLLNSSDKVIASMGKIGTTDQRIAVLGLDNAISAGLLYHANCVESRETRMAYAVAEVHTRLPDHGGIVMKDIIENAHNMFNTYVFFGVEGTIEDGPWDSPDDEVVGIADYFYGRTGTIFEGAGLKDKPWTPRGMTTMLELSDKLYNILVLGEY